MKRKILLVSVVALMLLTMGCLGENGGENPTTSSSSQWTSQSTSFSQSLKTSSWTTTSLPGTTTTTSSSSKTSSTSPQVPRLEVLRILSGINSYRTFMRTNITFSVAVVSGGVSKLEHVSIFSNENAFFEPAEKKMELNMSTLTYPAGGLVKTRMILLNDAAYVNSFGSWKIIKQGEDGYGPILGALETNPLGIIREALQRGLCTVSGSEGDFYVSCSGLSDLPALKKLVEISVGGDDSTTVELRSGSLTLKLKNGVPIYGEIEVSFKVSGSSTDVYGNKVEITQEGSLLRYFEVLDVNTERDLNPPVSR